MTTRLRWVRAFPGSSNIFDLTVINPQEVDAIRMTELLRSILEETHRGVTLSASATQEFERWFAAPSTPLKSMAYVLLSNWFTTRSGDRHSIVASRCEVLWDALFPCRPTERLSSSQPGRNHVILPTEFERLWKALQNAPGSNEPENNLIKTPAISDTPGGHVHTKFNKGGMQCEVEGSPQAVAKLLQILSEWKPGAITPD